MYSSIIGKIEKAKRYAGEKNRVKLDTFVAQFQGEHGNYIVEYSAGSWSCACGFFTGHGTCSHSRALQRMLEGMIPVTEPAANPV